MKDFDEIMYYLIENEKFWKMINHKAPPKPKETSRGTKGIVYDIGGNKSIKITEDDAESYASSIVAKKGKVEGVNRIYGVYVWVRYSNYFIIVQDGFKVVLRRAGSAVDDIVDAFLELYPKIPSDYALESEWYRSVAVEDMADVLDNKDSINIVKGLGSLKKLGISLEGLHAGNIGFDKRNNAVIANLEYAKSYGGGVKVFERHTYGRN